MGNMVLKLDGIVSDEENHGIIMKVSKEISCCGFKKILSYVEVLLHWSHSYLVNLIPKYAGKSQAMRWCFEQYSIDQEKAFAFGDGFNDADMLRAVGHPVAMGNATPELKELAEYVTGTVDEDGIYQALKYYGLMGSAS